MGVKPRNQKYSAYHVGQISALAPRVSPDERGGSRSSRTRGGMRWTRRRRMTNAVVADGEAVWSWRPDAGVKFSRKKLLGGDGAKKARSPGRARNKPVNHRAGKAGLPPLNLYARVRFFVHFCTRDRGCSAHPAFPAPSCSFRGRQSTQNSGASRRENADVHPLAV